MIDGNDEMGEVIGRASVPRATDTSDGENPTSLELTRQIEELRVAVTDLRESLMKLSDTAVPVADALEEARVEIENTLKSNVFASIGVAAFVGYVWGRFR